MKFIDLAKLRCSTRSFTKQSISNEDLMLILEAGRIAPTTANTQSHRVLVIDDEEGLRLLSDAAQIYGAPCALVISVDHAASWKRAFDSYDSGDIDATVVMTHMMLQASELGLGNVWVGYFKPERIKELFKLPESWVPVHILCIGYANVPLKDPQRHQKQRLPLSKTVFYRKDIE
ncbi:MAG TPA: nitroreductase [Erysipelotrichaceae bacterium]|nr:nitroreductase [Erysipelotrichaceae bacterium]